MGLFKFPSKKSSRVKSEVLTEKVEALRSELSILDRELQNIVNHQSALHEQLDDLEDLVLDLGKERSSPAYINPN